MEEIRLLEAGSRCKLRQKEHGIERELVQDPDRLRRSLDHYAPPQEAARVIIVGPVGLHPDLESSDPRAPIRLPTTSQLREVLPDVLAAANLDWVGTLMRSLDHYHHEIDRDRVEAWRYQFRRFDGAWIAEALLKLLDFWPSNRVSEALFRVPGDATPSSDADIQDWLASYDHIGFNKPDSGDSSTMISRLAKTRIGKTLAPKRIDFHRHVTESAKPTRVLLLEDCLVTGTEIVKLLESLPADNLRKHEIDFKFAVATQSGCKRLDYYLKQRGFTQVRWFVPSDNLISNLSEAGAAAPETSLFGEDGELVNPSAHIIDGIQLRGAPHFSSDERNAITSLSRAICWPLLESHLRDSGWSKDRVVGVCRHWLLGFSGLGLLLAMAHGVPKPTLPLFWLEGHISVEHKGRHPYRWRGDWIPLFPPPLDKHMIAMNAPQPTTNRPPDAAF